MSAKRPSSTGLSPPPPPPVKKQRPSPTGSSAFPAQWSRMFGQFPNPCFCVNSDRVVVCCNQAALQWLRVSSVEHVVGKEFFMQVLTHLDTSIDDNIKRFRQVINTKTPNFIRLPTGEQFCLNLINGIEDEEEIRISIVAVDATGSKASKSLNSNSILFEETEELETRVKERLLELERMNAELLKENAERRRVEQELALVSMVAQKTDTSVIITDHLRKTLWVNKAFTETCGFTLAEMIGKNPGELLQCPQTEKGDIDVMKKELSDCKPFCIDLMNRKKDGTLFMVNLDMTPVFDPNGELTHFFALQREISSQAVDRMRAAAVEQAKAQALANKLKTEFIMNMSHELRTPLNGILGMTSALIHSPLTDEADVRSGLETIQISSKLLLTLINNVIDFSKIESGKMSLEEVITNLPKLVKETVDSVTAMAREKHVEIVYAFHDNVPQTVSCDGLKVRQVLTNLIGNAIKFTRPSSKISVDVCCELKHNYSSGDASQEEPMVNVKFAVTDQGPGIPEDKIANLFGRFVQLDQAQETKSRYGGSGLGLHISQQLSFLMRGRLWVEKSIMDVGSTFSFQFPCKVVTEIPKTNNNAESLESLIDILKATASPLKIMVAEDNTINQRVIIRLLSRFGFKCSVVSTGEEALKLLSSSPDYDLIFMDLNMPVMDGITAARRIKEMNLKNTPRITAVTAHVLKEEMDSCVSAGMDFYMSKPITASKLYNFFKSFFTLRESNSTDLLISPTPSNTITSDCANSIASEAASADLNGFDPSADDILIATPQGFQRVI
jgi:PAS domain S-box-containing protein